MNLLGVLGGRAVISYNVLSLCRAGRLEHILHRFRWAGIICLQSTQLRANRDYDVPVEYWIQNNFHIFSAGYKSNKSTGCMICINVDFVPPVAVRQIFFAPSDLQGRGLGMRIKFRNIDILLLNAYFPVAVAKPVRSASRMISWLRYLLRHCPIRCMPLMLGDLNGRIGTAYAISGHRPESPAHGPFAPVPNAQGTMILELLEEMNLYVLGSERPMVATFHSSMTNAQSVIDYAITSQKSHQEGAASNHFVMTKAGRQLQMIAMLRPADHMPISIWLSNITCVYVPQPTFKWDQDAMMNAVLKGRHRQQYFDALHASFTQHEGLLKSAEGNHNPSAMLNWIMSAMRDAASQVFQKQPQEKPQHMIDLSNDRQKALKDINAIRKRYDFTVFKPGMLKHLFCAWKVMSTLLRSQRLLRKCRQIYQHARTQDLEDELNHHICAHGMAEAWRTSRLIAGTAEASKRKWGRSPLMTNATSTQITEFMQKPAEQGGLTAKLLHTIPNPDHLQDTCAAYTQLVEPFLHDRLQPKLPRDAAMAGTQ